MASALATELKIDIAQYLFKTRDDLRSLSLVSRGWQASAQNALFQVLRVHFQTNTIADLLSFLTSSPHLCTYISSVELLPRRTNTVEISQILKLLAFIPKLRNLTIDHLKIDSVPNDLVTFAVANQVRRHCNLTVSRTVGDHRSFYLLLNHLACDYLSFTNEVGIIVPEKSPEDLALTPATFATLKSFDVEEVVVSDPDDVPPGSLWTQIALLSLLPDLEEVGLACNLDDAEWMTAVNKFLEMKGKKMTALRLDYLSCPVDGETEDMGEQCYLLLMMNPLMRDQLTAELLFDTMGEDGYGGVDPSWKAVSLGRCCPSLQSITFVLLVNIESLDDTKKSDAILQWRYALRLLASASTHSLTSVTLGLALAGDVPYEELEECTIESINWRMWEKVLQRFPNFKQLNLMRMDDENFGFSYFPPYQRRNKFPKHYKNEMLKFIARRMPSLVERGILQCEGQAVTSKQKTK